MRPIKNTTELIGVKGQNIIIFLPFFHLLFFENNFLTFLIAPNLR
ncbi:protein of unknown function [Streptococcus thermophilus]|nr:protein of unknown function [Streptococcus thermophilus]CAD0161772.1 protein of unknown function [Streptococcus thermophilus]